ncbi:MAG: AMP-binding protein [Smithellaceae bacterium]
MVTENKSDLYRNTRLTESCWPADTSRPILEWTIGRALREVAAEVPDRIALVDGVPDHTKRRRWTYAQLLVDAGRVAAALLSRFKPGERFAVWSSNNPEYVLIQYGCAIAGITMVTVNPAYKEREYVYVMKQSGAAGLIVIDEYRGYNMFATVNQTRKDLPDLREVIRFADFDAFLSSGNQSVTFPDVKPKDTTVIMYTSGTTGNQKGAMLHHIGLVNSTLYAFERAGHGVGCVIISGMPQFHVGAGGLATYGTLMRRGTYIIAPGFDPASFMELVESEGGTGMGASVPTIVEAVLNFPDRKKYNLSTMKTIICGGAMVEAKTVRRVHAELDCGLNVVYGQTEVHGLCCATHRDDSDRDQSETIGQPFPNCEMKIADPETGAVRPLGEKGEICVRSYQTMNGYYNMPEATAKALREGGWLHTGDLGIMDERGFIKIAGRTTDMIIRGGENIYPAEIETLLLEHPKVGGALVFGIPDDYWGEEVGAAIIQKSSSDRPTVQELFDFCSANLTRFKVPRLWSIVSEFPLTASGKPQKFKLREQIVKGDLKPERI